MTNRRDRDIRMGTTYTLPLVRHKAFRFELGWVLSLGRGMMCNPAYRWTKT
jgi:hypothetical protein